LSSCIGHRFSATLAAAAAAAITVATTVRQSGDSYNTIQSTDYNTKRRPTLKTDKYSVYYKGARTQKGEQL